MSKPTKCEHLLGAAMRSIDELTIVVYVTNWIKAASWVKTDEFNYCPRCGKQLRKP